MIIRSLAVKNLRSHRSFSEEISSTVTVFTGLNGSGKTTLLEAIMIALNGKSFKGTDVDLLRRNAPWWRIDLILDDQKRTVKYQPDAEQSVKQFIIDDQKSVRLPKTSRYPTVLFEPDDLRLLHGSPSRRRSFVDRFAAQLTPQYGTIVRRYERALQQRNKLLKSNAAIDSLFAWNVSLAKYGAQMVDMRVRLIERFNKDLNETYKAIAETKDRVAVHYSHTTVDQTEQKLLRELEQKTAADKTIGYTSVGPHRHDVLFGFNDKPAMTTASRGEIRTIVLALKFLEVDLLHEVTGEKPLILLDDVFSELDESRQKHLATKFQTSQIIMTSTAAPKILKKAKTIKI